MTRKITDIRTVGIAPHLNIVADVKEDGCLLGYSVSIDELTSDELTAYAVTEAAELEAERHKALQIVLDVASERTPQLDPSLQRLNKTAGYDIVSAICTTSPERKAWEKSYLEKRAAHVEKYWSGGNRH